MTCEKCGRNTEDRQQVLTNLMRTVAMKAKLCPACREEYGLRDTAGKIVFFEDPKK